jgi:AMP-polyphosphate phosphotransferase
MGHLDDLDLSLRLKKQEAAERLEAAQTRLLALRLVLGGLVGDRGIGPPVCVLFEGWDASGKGGAIKRLVGELDPRHVRVVQFAAPSYDEKRHHWLWRFWPALPGWGGMSVLDRSWYGRVLVERVEGLAGKEEWKRAYREIVEFEHALTEEGMVLVKFWMHISSDEQLKRFEARHDDPLKSWKLSDDDWENRARRAEYEAAVEDMFEGSSGRGCPRTPRSGAGSLPVHVGRQAALVAQLLEVRVERDARCAPQIRRDVPGNVVPGSVEQVVAIAQPHLERGKQLALALEAVLDVLVELVVRVVDDWAVPRAQGLEIELAQALQRLQVAPEPAAPGDDEAAAGACHGVAGERHLAVEQRHVVRGMAGGGERGERADAVAVVRADNLDPSGLLGERGRALVVVGMRVRDHDPVDRPTGRLEHRGEVLLVVRPRVDHPALDDVRVGAVQRERGRVGRTHAGHAGGDALGGCHI